jgi:hypothetical protein
MQEYCVAVMELETLKGSVDTNGDKSKACQSSSSESMNGKSVKYGSKNQSLIGIRSGSKDFDSEENNGGSNKSDKINDKEDDDNDDGDDGEDDYEEEGREGDEANASESTESDEDEDGGFAFPTEGSLEDPMEHALDTLLDIELEINRNTKKPRKK